MCNNYDNKLFLLDLIVVYSCIVYKKKLTYLKKYFVETGPFFFKFITSRLDLDPNYLQQRIKHRRSVNKHLLKNSLRSAYFKKSSLIKDYFYLVL